MQVRSPETIEQIKALAEAGEQGQYSLGEFVVRYSVVSLGEAEPFDMAAAAAFPDKDAPKQPDEQIGSILVCDDVPEELQGPWALHELLDFTVIGHQEKNRCVKSDRIIMPRLIEEDSNLADRYAEQRVSFYADLGAYMARNITEQRGRHHLQSCRRIWL